jgi:ABC-type dipeptide/oligopeptide/nickel transport system permease component
VQLPWSLRIGLGGAVLALIIGVALLIAAAVAPARAPTPWEPGAR